MPAYATAADLRSLGIPAIALEDLVDADIDDQLLADAGVIDVFLASQYSLPLSAPYPEFLRRCNVCLATWHIMLRRGYNPEGLDDNYKAQFEHCVEMLKMIAAGKLSIPGLVDDTPTVSESGPKVNTPSLRGW